MQEQKMCVVHIPENNVFYINFESVDHAEKWCNQMLDENINRHFHEDVIFTQAIPDNAFGELVINNNFTHFHLAKNKDAAIAYAKKNFHNFTFQTSSYSYKQYENLHYTLIKMNAIPPVQQPYVIVAPGEQIIGFHMGNLSDANTMASEKFSSRVDRYIQKMEHCVINTLLNNELGFLSANTDMTHFCIMSSEEDVRSYAERHFGEKFFIARCQLKNNFIYYHEVKLITSDLLVHDVDTLKSKITSDDIFIEKKDSKSLPNLSEKLSSITSEALARLEDPEISDVITQKFNGNSAAKVLDKNILSFLESSSPAAPNSTQGYLDALTYAAFTISRVNKELFKNPPAKAIFINTDLLSTWNDSNDFLFKGLDYNDEVDRTLSSLYSLKNKLSVEDLKVLKELTERLHNKESSTARIKLMNDLEHKLNDVRYTINSTTLKNNFNDSEILKIQTAIDQALQIVYNNLK